MGPTMVRPKVTVAGHRKAASVSRGYKLRESSKRTIPMPNTIPIQHSHLNEKIREEERQ